MNKKRSVRLLSLIFCILFAFSADYALADTINFSIDSYGSNVDKEGEHVDNIIVISQNHDSVSYYTLSGNGYIVKDWIGSSQSLRGGSPKNFKVILSSLKEKKKLLENWKQKANFAVIKRKFGPSKKLVGCGVKYPLPENVNYIMGSPDKKIGAEFYIGKKTSDADKVTFKEIIELRITNGGKTAEVTWTNSDKSKGPLLNSWKYGSNSGAPAVIFGIDFDTCQYFEIPFKSIKHVAFAGFYTVQCEGKSKHKFTEPLSTWKYCPIDGKALIKCSLINKQM